MTRTQKITLLLGAVGMTLILGIIIGWCFRGPPKGTEQMMKFFEALAPKTSTDSDWKAAVVQESTVTVSQSMMPVRVANHIRPILEPEADTSAHHIAITNERSQNELVSYIWSHKCNNSLKIDWNRLRIERANKPLNAAEFYLSPENVPGTSKQERGYRIYTPGGSNELVIRAPHGKKALKWQRNSFVGESYFFKDYRYASGLESSIESKKTENLVLVDLFSLDVAGYIPLPPQVGRYAPLMVLDPNTDLLLVFDLDIAWIVCMDLRPGIDQSKKPWPPPWPHPALGPWHGNHDVMAGRLTQLPEGATPPPRPTDYP